MMGLRDERQAANVARGGGESVPPARKMEVSQETLDLLRQGHASLVQRRQQVAQQLQDVDAAIQRQLGGIQIMEGLLAGESDDGDPPKDA